MINKTTIAWATAVALIAVHLNANAQTDSMPGSLFYNQVGYQTEAPKTMWVAENIQHLNVVNMAGKTIMRLKPEPTVYWKQAGIGVRAVKFSNLRNSGTYTIVLSNGLQTPLLVSDNPYSAVSKAALQAFYLNRSGMAISPDFASKWARPMAHPDTVVYIHPSAASPGRPAGSTISSPGGWYDAGDYNKYIVNSSISVYTLCRALEDFPAYFKNQSGNLPESSNGLPDLLNEILYNYRWMLTMQDSEDGGVYHKLTNERFDPNIMPHKANEKRFVVMKTTAATLDFAATAAHMSMLLKQYPGLDALAGQSLKQAQKAWQWAMQNPQVLYKQPADIFTGQYGDKKLTDEWFWAAAELYLATRENQYEAAIIKYYEKPQTPEWAGVHTLGILSLLNSYENLSATVRQTNLKDDFYTYCNKLVDDGKLAPMGISLKKYNWGSNSDVANQGMLKLMAYKLTARQSYLQAARADLDYILGENATGYCFVTGFGQKRVMNIHHRPSMADGIAEPIPGFLAGGPNIDTFEDCPNVKTRSRYPARSYLDLDCSYSTNEIAINWNAPLVYLLAAFAQ